MNEPSIISLLSGAIIALFGLIVVGAKVLWGWLTLQFDYMKAKIQLVEDKLDKEREQRDKEMEALLQKILSKIDTQRIQRNSEDEKKI